MNYVVGNAGEVDTGGTGWFIGFSDWTRYSDLLHVPKDQGVTGLCVKWYDHPSGQESGEKPVSEGRTVSILVTGDSAFSIDFSGSPLFEPEGVETVVLQRRGDFVAWGEGLFHRWRSLTPATVLTVRWLPDDGGEKE